MLRDWWRRDMCASLVSPTNSISRRICTREKDDVRIGPDWEPARDDVVKFSQSRDFCHDNMREQSS